MSNTLIIYNSQHHGNTRKVVETVREVCGVDISDIQDIGKSAPDLGKYDTVAFASGIYFGKVAEQVSNYVNEHKSELKGKKTFAIVTCGVSGTKGRKLFLAELEAAGMMVQGSFQCHGYDTYGFFGHIGGIKKKHPTPDDCKAAADCCSTLMREKALSKPYHRNW